MKQKRRVRGAGAEDTRKISAPVPMSGAATAEKTTKHFQETAQYSNGKQRTYTQTTDHPETSRTYPNSLINLPKRSKKQLTQLHQNPRLYFNKKVNQYLLI